MFTIYKYYINMIRFLSLYIKIHFEILVLIITKNSSFLNIFQLKKKKYIIFITL